MLTEEEKQWVKINNFSESDRIIITPPKYIFNLHKICERSSQINFIQPKWKSRDTFVNTSVSIPFFEDPTSSTLFDVHEVIVDVASVDNACVSQVGYSFKYFMSKGLILYPESGIK